MQNAVRVTVEDLPARTQLHVHCGTRANVCTLTFVAAASASVCGSQRRDKLEHPCSKCKVFIRHLCQINYGYSL